MRKWIALCSMGMIVGFAIALANADDTASNPDAGIQAPPANSQSADTSGAQNQDQANPQMNGQQANGQQGGTMGNAPSMAPGTTSAMNKTCVDQNGNTLHKGEKGYKDCVKSNAKQANSNS